MYTLDKFIAYNRSLLPDGLYQAVRGHFETDLDFEVGKNMPQAVASDTLTKVTWQVEYENPDDHFSLLYDRYQPLVPGLYMITASIWVDVLDQSLLTPDIYKNGQQVPSRIKDVNMRWDGNIVRFVELNGAGDYVELWFSQRTSISRTINVRSRFRGVRIIGEREREQ